jgi:hypothetical protein
MQTKKQRDEWYLKNKERINEKRRIHYETVFKKDFDKIKQKKEKDHEYYLKNREKQLKRESNIYHTITKKNPKIMKMRLDRAQRWSREKRRIVIDHYSKGKNSCAICNERDIDVLTIDHINGGGNQHRIQVARHICAFLIKNNFPDGYRILCMNCNIKEARIKGFYGTKRFKSDYSEKKVEEVVY